jgi:leucine dehydrogenase
MEAIFSYMEKYDYENLFLCQDKALDFKAIIAIHDTTLVAACGSMTVRWKPLKMPCDWPVE